MGQGRIISDTQIELIKATFAETGSITAAAKAASCSLSTAKKYADSRDAFEALRSEKRVDIIEEITQVQIAFLAAMRNPVHLDKAELSVIAVSFGIVTDKKLLLTGQATSRSETITDPAQRLTPEEMELAARIREKHAVGVGV